MDNFETRKKRMLNPVFFEAGAGLMDSQMFEYGIAYYLHLLSRKGIEGLTENRTTAILEDDEKKTAGQLISMLKQHADLHEDVEPALVAGLKARNKLIHRSLTEDLELSLTDEGRNKLVQEIRSLRASIRKANEVLMPYIDDIAKELDGADLQGMRNTISAILIASEKKT